MEKGEEVTDPSKANKTNVQIGTPKKMLIGGNTRDSKDGVAWEGSESMAASDMGKQVEGKQNMELDVVKGSIKGGKNL